MKRIRRIGFIGGPGCGKSTSAAWLMAQLKMAGVDVELVQEYVKNWAFEKRHPERFDQVFLIGQQMRQEDLMLRNGVEVIVTESPVLMSACYGKWFKAKSWKHLIPIALDFEKQYPSLNIFLTRGEEYNTKGRFQSKDDAVALDKFIRSIYLQSKHKIFDVMFNDQAEMLRLSKKALKLPSDVKPS